MTLAVLMYTAGDKGLTVLPDESFTNPEMMEEYLEKYDVVYLLKAEFVE